MSAIRRAALSLAIVNFGCEAPERAAPRRPTTDKAALFGDAKLVPTREGERARRELAEAGEIQALLEHAGFADVRVSVSRTDDASPARVAIVVRPPMPDDVATDPETTELAKEQVTALARQISGPSAATEVVLAPRDATPPRRPATDPLLWLALLGFGASAGVMLDRLRRRR